MSPSSAPRHRVPDAEPVDVRVPGRGIGDRLVGQPQHLAGEAEQPVEDGLQRQVAAELVRVHGEVASAEAGVAVAPVPRPERRILAVLVEDLVQPFHLPPHGGLEGRHDPVVEGRDGLRIVGHLHLDREVSPRGVAEQRGDPATDPERLRQERLVHLARLVELAMLEIPAQVAAACLAEERVELGQIEAHPERAGQRARAQARHVVVGQAVELVRG